MKIAIATENGRVSAHFGRCPSYTVVDIEQGAVVTRAEIPNPGHRPGFLPEFLSGKGVNAVIAGGMGPRAQALFEEKNITTFIGVQGPIEEVIGKLLENSLESGEDLCDHGPGEAEVCGEDPPAEPAPIPAGAKICLTAAGNSWDAEIDPRFGRAPYFLMLDPVARQLEAIKNPYNQEAQGAGIRAAQLMLTKGVRIILTGRVGPKADQVLKAAGVQVITGTSGRVKDVVQKFAEETR
jgi:predicted Fe-Mo cluster-binding NifX family protein